MSGEDSHLEMAFEDAISGGYEELVEQPYPEEPDTCWGCGNRLDDGVWEDVHGNPICWVCEDLHNEDDDQEERT